MESPELAILPPNFDVNDMTNLSDEQQDFLEAPVTDFLAKDVTKMSFSEINEHVARLREMRSGIDGVKTLLKADAEAIRERKPRAKRQPKHDLSLLL